MPARAYKYPAKRATTQQARRRNPAATAPPSGDLINAVIQYGDLIVDLGGGRSMLRLSARRMTDPVICGPLGREAHRLAEVAVIWNDEQDEIVRVLDGARGDVLAPVEAMQPLADEPLELTPEALAYLAATHGCLH